MKVNKVEVYRVANGFILNVFYEAEVPEPEVPEMMDMDIPRAPGSIPGPITSTASYPLNVPGAMIERRFGSKAAFEKVASEVYESIDRLFIRLQELFNA